MTKIIAFEKRRVAVWLTWFVSALLALVVFVVAAIWVFGAEVVRRQTVDLVALFAEDREIIAEFWQDTVQTIVAELPLEPLLLGAGVVGVLALLWVVTKRERGRILHRVRDLASFRGKCNNTHRRRGYI